MSKQNIFVVFFLLLLNVLIVGCNPVASTSTPTTTRTAPDRETSTQTVTVTSGGTIEFSDGSKVALSSGAVSAETEISVTKAKNASELQGGFAGYMKIGPDNLVLSKPATITMKYNPDEIPDPSKVNVVSYSELNPEINLGSEISRLALITPEAIDTAKSTVSFKTNHFSVFSYFWEYPAYLVLGLPGKYLKKGDLIYVLTNAMASTTDGAWIPGHTGLYLGTKNPDSNSNDGSTIVESTPKEPKLGQNEDGVQFSTLDNFKTLSGQHIFMGARRPKNVSMTSAHRDAIAKYAISKVGKVGFRAIGGGSFLNIFDSSSVSCVGFTELSYARADISIVPEISEALLYPIRQFNYTSQVDDITVQAEETIDFLVYGVVRTGLRYSKEDKYYSITATSDPDIFGTEGAKFTKYVNAYDLNWKPKKSNVGKSFVVTFVLTGGGLSSITQKLKINVSGSYFPMIDGAKYQYNQTVTRTTSSGTTTQKDVFARTITSGATNEITDVFTHDGDSTTQKMSISSTEGFIVFNNNTISDSHGRSTNSFSPYWKVMPSDLKDPKTSWTSDFTMTIPAQENIDPQITTIKETSVVGDDYETITVNGVKYENVLKISRTRTGTVADFKIYDKDGKYSTIKTDEFKWSTVEYFAPGVGLLKGSSEQKTTTTVTNSKGVSSTQSSSSTTIQDLVSYTIP